VPRRYLSSKITKLVVIAAVCLLLVFLNPKGIFGPVSEIMNDIAYPFQKTAYFIGRDVKNAFLFLSSIRNLKEEDENLIRENNKLVAQIAQLQDMKKENEALRKEIDLLPRGMYDLVAAYVISQDPNGLGSWIEIGKGRSDGIDAGMPVIVSDGILVGRVGEVFANSSKVNLLTDANSTVNVQDLETGSKGAVKGQYGLGLVMGLVAQADVINEGDTIVTSGLSQEMPKGLLVGKVQKIVETPDKLFQEATLFPRVNYRNLEIVFVIKGIK
jgi:rod shape-determining protein MreC